MRACAYVSSFRVVGFSVAFILAGPVTAWAEDCNANGVSDDQDIANGTSEDCNGNGIPDGCELWPEQAELIAADTGAADGTSVVAITGNTMVVGAP